MYDSYNSGSAGCLNPPSDMSFVAWGQGMPDVRHHHEIDLSLGFARSRFCRFKPVIHLFTLQDDDWTALNMRCCGEVTSAFSKDEMIEVLTNAAVPAIQ